jgi:hypothetical protein
MHSAIPGLFAGIPRSNQSKQEDFRSRIRFQAPRTRLTEGFREELK